MKILTDDEKKKIYSFRGKLNELSDDLKSKLIKSILNDESPFEPNNDDICCDFGLGPRDRYKKTSAQDCKQLNGTVVDDSNCP